MAKAKYAFQGMKESMARAMKRDAEISFKVAIEMSAFLKGRSTTEAKKILERVLKKTQAIPFKKFNDGVGHRKGAGIAAGRYPQKGAEIFTDLIKSAEANAQAKGLSSNLKIIHLAPQKASGAYHYGRQRRRKFKRAHIEIVVQEMEKEAKTEKKTPAKKETKQEEKESMTEKTQVQETQTEKKEKTEKTVTAPKEKRQSEASSISEKTGEFSGHAKQGLALSDKPEKKSESKEKSEKSEKPKAPKKEPKKSQEDKQ